MPSGGVPLQLLGVQFVPGTLNADQLAHLEDIQAAAHAVIADRSISDRDLWLAVSDLREEAALLARAEAANPGRPSPWPRHRRRRWAANRPLMSFASDDPARAKAAREVPRLPSGISTACYGPTRRPRAAIVHGDPAPMRGGVEGRAWRLGATLLQGGTWPPVGGGR
jgi:hypothetical protein